MMHSLRMQAQRVLIVLMQAWDSLKVHEGISPHWREAASVCE